MKFHSIRIQHKLIFAFLILVVLSSCGGVLSYYLLRSIRDYQNAKNDVARLSTLIVEAGKAEKAFIVYDQKDPEFYQTSSSTNLRLFEQHLNEALNLVYKLEKHQVIQHTQSGTQLIKIEEELTLYSILFKRLTQYSARRGFKDWGYIGDMRTYVHAMEDEVKSPEEAVFALSLRRHEKDFLLRKDQKYIAKIENTAQQFVAYLDSLEASYATPRYKAEITAAIEQYLSHFNKIVSIAHVIGITRNEGIMGDLARSNQRMEPMIAHLYASIDSASNARYSQSVYVLIASTIFLICAALLMSYWLTRVLSRPVVQLDKVVNAVLEGADHTDAGLHDHGRKDEIGSLIRHFKVMLNQMRTNIKLANDKNAALEQAAVADGQRRWTAEGLARFADVMKANDKNLGQLANEIIEGLVKYTNCNQGGLFILDTTEANAPVMRLEGCYAYNRRKKTGAEIMKGEGLVGRCWLERDRLLLTDVPDDYINITSGLGRANPKCILIVPVVSDHQVEAIIELASFKVVTAHEIDFVERLAERLAGVIASVKMQQTTATLLTETRQMAKELQANEEEMRQNMEALEATQEELTRTNADMSKNLDQYKRRLNFSNNIIGRFYKGMIIANRQQEIRYANPYVLRKLGYDEAALVGSSLKKVFKGNIEAMVSQIVNDPNFLLHGFTQQREERLVAANGQSFKVFLLMTTMVENGNEYRVLLFNKVGDSELKKILRGVNYGQLVASKM